MRPYVLAIFACLGLSKAQTPGDRQVRLDDIERDNLKSPQQTPQQQRPQQYATQQYTTQYQQQPLLQYTQFYNIPAGPSGPVTQLFAQPSLTPGQLTAYHQQVTPGQLTAYHQQVAPGQLPSYHQQLLFTGPQQISQPVLIPQHQSLPFPVMLIPSSYLLQQDVNSLLYGGGLAQQAKYAAPAAQQIPAGPSKGFKPSPQISGFTASSQYAPSGSSAQYQNPQQYNAYQTVYQQKFAAGVKSTVAPPLKDNYVGQSSNVYSSYKTQ